MNGCGLTFVLLTTTLNGCAPCRALIVFPVKMPRKFKLCHKKNEERRKYEVKSLIVSVPLSLVSIRQSSKEHSSFHPDDPLIISLPLILYLNTPLRSLSALESKVKMMPQLVDGWMEAICTSSELKFCYLEQSGPCPSVLFSVCVQADRTWQVYYKLSRIEPDTAAFQGIPSVIETLSNFRDLIVAMNTCKFCTGNSAEKFPSVLSHHSSGIFLDRTGV